MATTSACAACSGLAWKRAPGLLILVSCYLSSPLLNGHCALYHDCGIDKSFVHYGFLVSGIKCYALIRQICILFLGEFTLRAFLNGRLDLAQAENVSRLISAKSAAAADSALAGIQVISSWAYIDAPVQR